jgi:hypothetical protein
MTSTSWPRRSLATCVQRTAPQDDQDLVGRYAFSTRVALGPASCPRAETERFVECSKVAFQDVAFPTPSRGMSASLSPWKEPRTGGPPRGSQGPASGEGVRAAILERSDNRGNQRTDRPPLDLVPDPSFASQQGSPTGPVGLVAVPVEVPGYRQERETGALSSYRARALAHTPAFAATWRTLVVALHDLGEQYLELGGAQVDRFLADLPDAGPPSSATAAVPGVATSARRPVAHSASKGAGRGAPRASGCTDRPTEAAEAEGESAIGPPDEVVASIAPEDSTAEVADDLTRRAQPGLVSPSSPTNDLHKLVNKEGGVNRAGLLPKRSNSMRSLRAFE